MNCRPSPGCPPGRLTFTLTASEPRSSRSLGLRVTDGPGSLPGYIQVPWQVAAQVSDGPRKLVRVRHSIITVDSLMMTATVTATDELGP